jgi:DegV family protein with EDD domain
MDYKIVLDSCGELTYKMKESGIYHTAVLSMLVDGDTILDDESFDRKDFLKRVAVSPECPKSSCPSPDAYMELYGGAEKRVYVVTLSAELSGSYNSAQLGKELWKEENEDGDKQIYVFNSRSASVGESLIALKIQECEEKGYSFEEVIEHVEAYIEEQHTYFVLETLETLRKNGRLTGLKAIAATVLNIKPVMGATPKGEICQLGQARGIKKALKNMVDCVIADLKDPESKVLAISHCNCPQRAQDVKKMLEERVKLKDIIILDTRGVSSMYANDGGVIVAV